MSVRPSNKFSISEADEGNNSEKNLIKDHQAKVQLFPEENMPCSKYSSIRALPHGVAVIEGSPIRYNTAPIH